VSSTPFERPFVLDLGQGRLGYAVALLWTVGLVHTICASVAPEIKLVLLTWTAVWLMIRAAGRRGGAPLAARWHLRTGWHLRLPKAGWRPAVLLRAHPISTDLQLLCWQDADGRRWARLVGPGSAAGTVRRRLRVLLRFGRFFNDG